MTMNDHHYIDNEEKELMESLNGIDLKSIQNDTKNSQTLQKSAKAYVKNHESKMNIRISSSELEKIKQRAADEGLKYQSLIKSILHKYLTGQLVEKGVG